MAVLRPGTVEDVSAAVRACAAEGIAVVPAGGRTGLCGGAVVPENGPPAAVLSLERLNRIRAVDARDFSLVAEAGCVVQQVQEAAVAVDRLFPLSWGAQGSAQVGGALSTNAGGIRTLRWGNARDLVLGLEVVLPDGRVLNDLRRVRKDNSGYALATSFSAAKARSASSPPPPSASCRRSSAWKPPSPPCPRPTPRSRSCPGCSAAAPR